MELDSAPTRAQGHSSTATSQAHRRQSACRVLASDQEGLTPMMDYALLLQQLSQAEARIANGVRVIARQRKVIAALVDDGHVAEKAEIVLTSFEQAQATNFVIHEDIKQELARTAW